MAFRTVSLVGAGGLVAGWLLASVLVPPVASLQSNPPRPTAEPRVEPAPSSAPSPYAERLRSKLRTAPDAPTVRRNPFTFDDVRREPAAPRVDETAAAPAPSVSVEAPLFELAGLAATETADGLERTAIISTRGEVVLARVGDVLSDGSRVTAIDERSVTLVDAEGRTSVLPLK